MAALPVVRGSSAALYPFVMAISFSTLVVEAQDGSQQRSARRGGLVRFEIPYAALTQSQKNTVRSAVESAKGQFDTGLTLAFGGTTYTHLSLDSDEFAMSESVTMQYDAPMKLSQAIAQDLSPGTAGTDFPTLANGALCQLPYVERLRNQTVVAKMPAGPKWTFAEFGGGLSGYPSVALRSWELREEHLSDADLATRIAHFVANSGKLYPFTFTDEAGTTYASAHYGSDEIVIHYAGPNDAAVTTVIEATA